MQMLRSSQLPTRRLAGSTALLLIFGLLVALAVEALEPNPIEAGSGPWRTAIEEECENIAAGTVCAEWPSAVTNTVTVCCVDPNVVGTYQGVGQGCSVQLTQRAFN